MTPEQFWEQISKGLEIPFEIKEVKEVDGNMDTVWITLNNGREYWINFNECIKCNEFLMM